MAGALSFDPHQDFTDSVADPRPVACRLRLQKRHLLCPETSAEETCNPMVETARSLQTVNEVAADTGLMTARWLRLVWPRNTEKEAARTLSVDARTARGWLEGNRPNGSHFDAMVALWGEPFTAFVYAPLYGLDDEANRYARARAQISALQNTIEKMRKRGAA